MNILFLSAAGSIHTIRWVNALSELGHNVTLVSKIDHEDKSKTINEKVKIVYLPFGGMKGYYFNIPFLKRFYKRNQNFDVINVHYASGYGTLARMSRLPHVILNVWGSDVYDFPYKSRIHHKIISKNLEYAYILASTSHSMAEQTKKLLLKEKEIHVTPFGVDVDLFRPISKKKVADNFTFGIVKTLSPKYGVETVIKAFAKFLERFEDEKRDKFCLEIYGKGELLGHLQQIVRDKKIESQVFFRGFVNNSDVPSKLNQMEVFLLGSEIDSESFGVAAVEAMACELPVIATKVSGFCEVIEDKVTGFLVSIGDYEKMAEYMYMLYQDKDLRERMGQEGRERVLRLYDWKKNVTTMLELYEKSN